MLPVALYESLLPKLVKILELTQQQELNGPSAVQAKQNLFLATNDFKNAIAQAKDFALNLPGGEMLIEEQDEVIAMLERLKARKMAQLTAFTSKKVISNSYAQDGMEVDSLASTPQSGSGSDS
ncbi:hypothetical protein CPC08DRAFT_765321 [Agrocybe pediades]|nr:hypothetical protein CPC08DRAFT_765321 [Agrocybe pediades]